MCRFNPKVSPDQPEPSPNTNPPQPKLQRQLFLPLGGSRSARGQQGSPAIHTSPMIFTCTPAKPCTHVRLFVWCPGRLRTTAVQMLLIDLKPDWYLMKRLAVMNFFLYLGTRDAAATRYSSRADDYLIFPVSYTHLTLPTIYSV